MLFESISHKTFVDNLEDSVHSLAIAKAFFDFKFWTRNGVTSAHIDCLFQEPANTSWAMATWWVSFGWPLWSQHKPNTVADQNREALLATVWFSRVPSFFEYFYLWTAKVASNSAGIYNVSLEQLTEEHYQLPPIYIVSHFIFLHIY